jgi:two-component system, NtrC family, nitrogen regulation response regulator NtrX
MKPRRLTPGALQALQSYGWPGNVRELKNVVERLMILGPSEEIGAEDLPFPAAAAGVAADGTLKQAREEFERHYILAALRRHRGNVTRTAEALDLERSHLHRKLKGYGIEVERE